MTQIINALIIKDLDFLYFSYFYTLSISILVLIGTGILNLYHCVLL